MSGKLANGFEYYLGLGPSRTYEAVASHFAVSKRSVTKRAAKENWQGKIAEIEAKARAAAEKRAVDTLEEMNDRHLKSLRVVQGRALEALRAMPIDSAMDAVRALDIAIRQERVVRGEPADRTAVAIEDTIKREYSSWMTTADEEHGGEEEADE